MGYSWIFFNYFLVKWHIALHTTFITLIFQDIIHYTLSKKPTNTQVLSALLCVYAAISHTTLCGLNRPSLDCHCLVCNGPNHPSRHPSFNESEWAESSVAVGRFCFGPNHPRARLGLGLQLWISLDYLQFFYTKQK